MMDAREDAARCEEILRAGSKSFHAASRLLPRRVRSPAVALYAFCRHADDDVDEGDDPRAAVGRLRARLERVYAGRPEDGVVERAFAHVVDAFAIPRVLPEALIDGMEWDALGRRYSDATALEAYCARVASSVGAMMTVVMGARSRDVLSRACDLGVAMQLTNVARDVGEDAARGRLYLPDVWMREAGLDADAWLARPAFDERIASVVARLLARADELYARADAGVAMLPRDCRVGIRAARLIYSDIGARIARARFDSVSQRAIVPRSRKLWLLVRALWPVRAAREHRAAPALEAVRFLVDAAAVPS